MTELARGTAPTRRADPPDEVRRPGAPRLRRAEQRASVGWRASTARSPTGPSVRAAPLRPRCARCTTRSPTASTAAWPGAARLIGLAADTTLGRRRVLDGRALSTTPRGAVVVGALTGLIGDRLARDESDLHEPISVRVGGRPVDARRGSACGRLAAAHRPPGGVPARADGDGVLVAPACAAGRDLRAEAARGPRLHAAASCATTPAGTSPRTASSSPTCSSASSRSGRSRWSASP